MAILYSIRDWDDHFEVSQSRRAGTNKWVALPTKHDGKGYRRIMIREDGPLIYCAWVLIVQIASKCPKRGELRDADGPLSAEDMAIKTSAPVSIFINALNVLCSREIGWMTCKELGVDSERDGSALPLQDRTGQDTTEQNKTDGAAFAANGPDESPAGKKPKPATVRAEDVPVPQALATPEFLAARDAWFVQRRSKRLSLRGDYLAGQYKRLLPLGPADAAACLLYTVAQDYEGIFPERFEHGKRPNKTDRLRPGSTVATAGDRGL